MPSDSFVHCVVRDVGKVRHELTRMNIKSEAATLAALKAVQAKAKRNIRSRLRGRPRWDRRGASSRTGEGVNLHLNPPVVVKGGGPGRLTGTLSRGVGGVKRPKPLPGGGFRGGVGVGIPVNNLYKKINEARFPYFEPAIKKTEGEAAEIWAKAWRRSIRR